MGVFHILASADTEACRTPERTDIGCFLTLCVLGNPTGILLYLFPPPAELWVNSS